MAQIIWTKHLQQRLRQRQISPSLVDRTIRFPDRVEKSKTQASQKHLKNFSTFQVIAAVKRQGNDWIVTSVWKKPLSGSPSSPSRSLLEKLVYRLILSLEKSLRRRFN